MKPTGQETGPDPMQANIARTVGFHALRKMSRMAQEIQAEERAQRRWARGLAFALGALALAAILLTLIAPEMSRGLLRYLSSFFR